MLLTTTMTTSTTINGDNLSPKGKKVVKVV